MPKPPLTNPSDETGSQLPNNSYHHEQLWPGRDDGPFWMYLGNQGYMVSISNTAKLGWREVALRRYRGLAGLEEESDRW